MRNTLELIETKEPTTAPVELKLEDQIDSAWKTYSLDAPKVPNPIPNDTLGLRRICIVINLVIPVSKVIFGLQYLNSCPTNTWLPIYILVGALLQSSFLIMFVYKPFRHTAALVTVGLTASLWMIIASINIIVEWKPNFFLGGWRYCNKTFFYFAFFVSISEYIILAVLVLYICTHFAYTNPEDTVSSV
ncbi:transmembrane protein 272-like isoform X1 [Euwallacea similis]|uniref:transmembrane protein 272-like isoform X1 n=1 Tax=Euwallacea similis TaxID=1736056 RepID=UPI00344CDC36